ncbi:transposase [Syntrophotalea acetylenica]|uniref:transposase n=1 Tax=Syntrophotalea acetylenica TaxID=29542 RepID=UPI002A35DC43|nr:transposase [Syntrophotalea acetylenica]MDY0262012.1 transposase [Syntrophotalea acetylenica]
MPKLPKTARSIHRKAKSEGWKFRDAAGKGGRNGTRREYHIDNLPKETRDALLEQAISNVSEDLCALPAVKAEALPAVPAENLPAPAALARWQRDTMDARCAILNLVEQLAETHGLNKAIAKVVAQAKAELLPEHIQSLVTVANARSGGQMGKQTLSRRTLYRWRELRGLGVTALAPREAAQKPLPGWVPYFLKVYRVPQKLSVPDALEQLACILPDCMEMPSESQCYRLLKKMSNVDREKGRRTGNEMRALKGYRVRDTSDMVPGEVYQCDGHSFKARVAHPVHGKPFKPEVCAVIDAATRLVMGWSAGLSESNQTVADALRHAITITPEKPYGGVNAIFYTDPGSGNLAKINADPAFGRYARLGITFKTGIVGNSQARGLVERLQQSLWIRAAKQLPTFCGRDMDGTTLYKTTKLVDAQVKKTGTSELLPSWPQFLDVCAQAVERYNNTPHSSLPKITDETGKRRHMTPLEMWNSFLARGWTPATMTDAELDDCFRPRVQVTTRRGQVRVLGQTYYNPELVHHGGEQVFAEYEVQDGSRVWVRDMDERLICIARFEANHSRMFARSATEKAMEDREARRLEVVDRKREEIMEERRGVIELTPTPEAIEARRELVIEMAAPQEAMEIPADDRGRYRLWCRLDARMDRGDALTDREAQFYRSFKKTRVWRAFRDVEEDLAIAK